MRISDWSSDVCSSDLIVEERGAVHHARKQLAMRDQRPRIVGEICEMRVLPDVVAVGRAAPGAGEKSQKAAGLFRHQLVDDELGLLRREAKGDRKGVV